MQHGSAAQLRHTPEKTRVVSLYVGGAFGSKGAITPRTAVIALAARRLNRPVKLVATRDQGFTLATHRAETRHHVRLAATRDGAFTAYLHDADEVSSGADICAVSGTDVTTRLYAVPNIASHATVRQADRDTPGFMRAPAEVPDVFALECAVDELALAPGMDPVDLRRANDAKSIRSAASRSAVVR